MAKLILSKDDTVLREITLTKERITIGRRPHNDIVIEDLAISGEHAVVVTVNGDSFLEDLNSTNGTQVNGQPVRMHFLQDGDVIELAQYCMRYILNDAEEPFCGSRSAAFPYASENFQPCSKAAIMVLNGPSAGREIELNKPLTTIGRSGIQVAVVSRSQNSYFLAHVEGAQPLLNGHSIGDGQHLLSNGDVIDLSGTQMKLHLR